jgi:tetratricopeptide (TPR) repeat protein
VKLEGADRMGRRFGPWWALLLLLVAVGVAHGGAVAGEFVGFDDDDYVSENATVLAGLTLDGARWAFQLGSRLTYFHPLTWLSLMTDAQLFGRAAWGFHLTNVLLHALTATLLWLVLRRATGRGGPSLAAALLWAVHPLTVEAVSWVTERKTVLSAALGLGAVLAYVHHAARPSWRRLALVTLLLATGLLAKPSLVALPALLLVLDAWPLRRLAGAPPGRAPGKDQPVGSDGAGGAPGGAATGPGRFPPRPPRALLLEKSPLVAVALVALCLAVLSARHLAPPEGPPRPAELRLAHAVASVPTYLSAAVWPAGLAAYHPYPPAVPGSRLALGLAAVALASLAAWRLRSAWPALATGWAWFLVMLSPSLGLMQAGLWPGWAERFAYLPLMGLATLVAFAGADLIRHLRLPRPVGPLVAGALGCALAVTTRVQVATWHDTLTLLSHATRVEPGSAVMHFNLGSTLIWAGRHAEARAELEEALRLEPAYADAHSQLGVILVGQGRFPEAAQHYQAALAARPDHYGALWNQAELLRGQGQLASARPYYRRFLAAAPVELARQRTFAEAFTSR